MALAFPKTNASALAPIGTAGLFWAWFGVSPKRAFWIGWLAGTVYFVVNFAWFGETAGALIAPFGFVLALGPALADGLVGFGLASVLVALTSAGLRRRHRSARALVPLGSAAAFAFTEWLRAEGLGELGVPFASLGYTQVETIFAPVAAFAGTYGITFLLCVLGAYAAYALRMRPVRGSGVDAGLGVAAVAACTALAFAFWPARTYPAPTVRVAAVQGDIPQSLKFMPGALDTAVERYTRLTLRAVGSHPALVVWPETVIPAAINENPHLQARFSALARHIKAELVVGTLIVAPPQAYNVLEAFSPDGKLAAIYRKRQLVPFAEHLPFRMLLTWIPWTANISNFTEGTDDGIFGAAGLRFGPIVCWESAFTKIVNRDVRDGATALVVATDDAWFGRTAGPYMHAQIAQMRAIETGRWIVRAASTGISGIIAPDGRYVRASPLDKRAVVTGMIGVPVRTAYAQFGAATFALLFAFLYVAVLVGTRRTT